jgi:hypothetical protein
MEAMEATEATELPLAREMWTLFEPLHAVTYFAPQARAAFEAAGLRGFWRGYFAGRAAPLGAVDAPLVTALFGVFAPSMVARAIPDVWTRATPVAALEARAAGAVAALRAVFPAGGEDAAAEANGLLAVAVAALDCTGRGLAAANAVLPASADSVERLWQYATLLREHRGDGHLGALVTAGLDGCEALVWRSSLDLDRASLQPGRGWTDEEWSAAQQRLAARGWLDRDGTATEAARQAQVAVEAATDLAAARPWQALAAVELDRLRDLLRPLARATITMLPAGNPIGLPVTY